MTQVATVDRILNGTHAQISVMRQSACAHDCSDCAGCGTKPMAVRAVASNPIGAKVGQQVVVESSSKKLFSIAGVVYLLPLALFLLGYLLAPVTTDAMRGLAGFAGFVLGGFCAMKYDRYTQNRGGFQFTITKLF